MKVGDLVQFVESARTANDPRNHGIVLRFDSYRGHVTGISEINGGEFTIVEVLWDTGCPEWILQSRTEKLK